MKERRSSVVVVSIEMEARCMETGACRRCWAGLWSGARVDLSGSDEEDESDSGVVPIRTALLS